MKTYYIALRDGRTGGIDVEGNLIVAVPPIWNGWRGGSFAQFCSYYKPVNMYEVPNAKDTTQAAKQENQAKG